ncbi:hypothetical protein AYM17_03810 [Coxiella burnetii]|uniref:hypothetical protein n=2 Tax=Coxiella burnetii TaxID=777 RepID=UPI0003060223|nr:hypothetical protein [Coxiella burnetii]ATN66582.1 hypothetical protein AYM17_03810 [Coxiella burnetii]OYK86424.1 hypothetical protein CbuQ229_04005 [Coxiella burnetii]
MVYEGLRGKATLLEALAVYLEGPAKNDINASHLKASPRGEDREAGENVLCLIACAAGKRHPAMLNSLADRIKERKKLSIEHLLLLLKETAQAGDATGHNTLWLIAWAAVKGHPAMLNALVMHIKNLKSEEISDLLQKRPEGGVMAGENGLRLIVKVAQSGHVEMLKAVAKKLMQLPRDKRSKLLTPEPENSTFEMLISVAARELKTQEFELLLPDCFTDQFDLPASEDNYMQKIFPLMKEVNELISTPQASVESLEENEEPTVINPVDKQKLEFILDQVTQIETTKAKTNLLSFILFKLQHRINPTFMIKILVPLIRTEPKYSNNPQIKQLYLENKFSIITNIKNKRHEIESHLLDAFKVLKLGEESLDESLYSTLDHFIMQVFNYNQIGLDIDQAEKIRSHILAHCDQNVTAPPYEIFTGMVITKAKDFLKTNSAPQRATRLGMFSLSGKQTEEWLRDHDFSGEFELN